MVFKFHGSIVLTWHRIIINNDYYFIFRLRTSLSLLSSVCSRQSQSSVVANVSACAWDLGLGICHVSRHRHRHLMRSRVQLWSSSALSSSTVYCVSDYRLITVCVAQPGSRRMSDNNLNNLNFKVEDPLPRLLSGAAWGPAWPGLASPASVLWSSLLTLCASRASRPPHSMPHAPCSCQDVLGKSRPTGNISSSC